MSQRLHWEGEITLLDYARRLCGMEVAAWEKARARTARWSVLDQGSARSDIPVYAGGITWIDADYDERTGEALRPMASDHKGLGFGELTDDELIEQTMMTVIVKEIREAACAGHCRITLDGMQLPPSLFVDGAAAAALIASQMEAQLPHGGGWKVLSAEEAASIHPATLTSMTASVAAPSPASDAEVKAWMIARQNALKSDGKPHGRDVILPAARERFGILHKVALEFWATRKG